ncbi:hypothetical protein D8674_036843 [Pyrus ussuriensis x Pyrus communis]|uniref:Uncharacterized protein n=1 Tax=Pyrus ussuriensis x Pyrus communis TaxID=2448454 RepID=A0A5N5GA73_9ROSA|nr:hypothetical protein D8674_036843 [Pyrus ussuriensis x Pyrus communis]
MGWEKKEDQSMPELFSIKINHGGKWFESAYTGDFMSFFEIDEMVKELGYDGFMLYHYRILGMSYWEGLRLIERDQDVGEMCKYVPRVSEIEMYLEHLTYNGDDEHEAEATEEGQGSGDEVEDGPLNANNEGDKDDEGDETEEGHEAEEVNKGTEVEANEEDDTTDNEFVDSDYILEDDHHRAVDDITVESVVRDAERGSECDEKVIYPEFNEEADMDDPKFEKGLKLRDAAQMYNEDSMQVKTYVGKHECLRIWRENPNCKVAWLVKRYVEKFRLNPSMPITTFMETVKEEIMVEIHLKTAYRVKAQCLKILERSNLDQYTKLWEYCDELRRTNPGACKNGFKNGCRQLVGLDGCHLKGVLKGRLLFAVGMDANNQTWVIAYVIVELENKDSWVWLLELLAADLGIVNQRAWTFISDKQKGLIPAFEKASTSKVAQPSQSLQPCTQEAPQPSSQPTQASQTTSKSTARERPKGQGPSPSINPYFEPLVHREHDCSFASSIRATLSALTLKTRELRTLTFNLSYLHYLGPRTNFTCSSHAPFTFALDPELGVGQHIMIRDPGEHSELGYVNLVSEHKLDSIAFITHVILLAPWLHGCGWRNFASWLHDFLDMDEGMDSPSSQEREPLSFHTKESIEEDMSGLGINGC